MLLQQRLHEMVPVGENGAAAHQHHHDLSARESALYQHMPQKTAACVLVISRNPEALTQSPDGHDNGICRFILDHAGIHRHNAVGTGLIDAGNDLAVPGRAESGLNLVAVMERIFHADNRADHMEAAQKFGHPVLLVTQLLRIRKVLQLAAAAFFINRAEAGITSFHLFSRPYRSSRTRNALQNPPQASDGQNRSPEYNPAA